MYSRKKKKKKNDNETIYGPCHLFGADRRDGRLQCDYLPLLAKSRAISLGRAGPDQRVFASGFHLLPDARDHAWHSRAPRRSPKDVTREVQSRFMGACLQ